MAGPYALVTGGSSGIGLATARELVQSGLDIVLMARGQQRLDEAARELGAMAVEVAVEVHAIDVADEMAVQGIAADLLSRRGPPLWIVTSAGIARPDYFEALRAQDFRDAMEINYFGTLHVVRALAPAMKAAGRGHIVMLSSAAGLVGVFGYAAYAPTKFAVRGLAEVLRAELKPHGVSVHVCCPPDTDTPQFAQENLTKPAETRAIGGSAGLLSATQVARAIVAGVRAGRFMIAPGAQAALLAHLHSLLAPVLRWSFDRAARQARPR